MLLGAGGRESSGDTDDDTFARSELLGKVDLVAGRVLEEVNIGDGVAFFDLQWHCCENERVQQWTVDVP